MGFSHSEHSSARYFFEFWIERNILIWLKLKEHSAYSREKQTKCVHIIDIIRLRWCFLGNAPTEMKQLYYSCIIVSTGRIAVRPTRLREKMKEKKHRLLYRHTVGPGLAYQKKYTTQFISYLIYHVPLWKISSLVKSVNREKLTRWKRVRERGSWRRRDTVQHKYKSRTRLKRKRNRCELCHYYYSSDLFFRG